MTSTGNLQPQLSAEEIFENYILPAKLWATITRGLLMQMTTQLVFFLTRSLLLLKPFSTEGDGFPIGWVNNGLYTLFHPSSWIYHGLMGGCFFLLGKLHLKNFRTSWQVHQGSGTGNIKNIWASVVTAFTSNGIINGITSLLAHILISACLLRCYLGILGPPQLSNLTSLCHAEYGLDRCINEAHLFLILSGFYTGLRVWWKLHGPSNGNALRFSLIQQSGNSLLRQQIFGEFIKECSIEVASTLHWFCLLYYLFGQRTEMFLADLVLVNHRAYYYEQQEATMPSFSLSDGFWYYFTLLFHAWSINALLHLNMRILHAIFCINMTKRIRFPIATRQITTTGASLDNSKSSAVPMMEAMKSGVKIKTSIQESALLLKHLAFQDFADLTAEQSKLRRSEIFTLSQPGGHPHHWNEVRSRCLDTIAEFSQDLEAASKPVCAPNLAASNNQIVSQLTRDKNEVIGTPTLARLRRLGSNQSPTSASSGIQELLPSGFGGAKILQYSSEKGLTKELITEEDTTILGRLKNYHVGPERISAALSSASTIFLTPGGGNVGDSAIRSVYAKSQVVIWAVEGLAHLVSASFSEDRYGVVQKDLPKVLEALLMLQQTVERHRKGSTATARKNRFDTRDLQLKQELRIALKSSLFRISVAFGERLEAVPLAPELRKKLCSYQSFAEA